jgi:TonB family protein
MSRKVLVKLTFASLPKEKFNSRTFLTSSVINIAILGGLCILGATVRRNIVVKRYTATKLYMPMIKAPMPQPITVKIPVSASVLPATKSAGIPKLDTPRIRIQGEEPTPELKPVVMADATPIPELPQTATTRPQVSLVAASKSTPAPIKRELEPRQSAVSPQLGTPKGSGSGKVAVAGWPGQAVSPQEYSVYRPIEVITGPRPEYTPEAKELHIQGRVVLRVTVSAAGQITVLAVVHGLGHGLDEAAERAVVQYRVRPAVRDGVPIEQTTTITVTFELASA